MTTRDVVERLVHDRDESTEVRSLLEAGIADDVTDYDFARGLETHLSAIGAAPGGGAEPGAAPAGSAPGASSGAGASSAKALALAIGVPVVSAIAALAVLATHAPVSTGPTAIDAPNASFERTTPADKVQRPEVAALPAEVSEDNGSAIVPYDDAPRVGSRVTTAQRHAVTQSTKVTLAENETVIHRSFPEGPVESNRAKAVPAEEAVGSAAPSSRATAPVVQDGPRQSEEAVARAERAKEEARRDAEQKLQREMEELMRAKRALSGNPKFALELTERGQREFQQSLLTEEREHVLLLALIGVGRVSEAERRAAPYLAKHPDSPFARRVRAALEARKTR
jgi:hypothetical protein